MTIGRTGKNLIFLISQPRSGSTLLQQMLNKQPGIHTTAEPWTMLSSVYGLRESGHEAEYNAQSAWLAVNDFIQQLPNQRSTYIEGLRLMHTHLYNSALEGTGCSHFLDKTPRYYHIIPELYEIFPEATFIFLLRNPLAVACSVMDTWIKGKWFKVYKYRSDLLDAPHRLVEGIQLLGDRSLIVNYEQLLLEPETVIDDITQRLNLPSSTENLRSSTVKPIHPNILHSSVLAKRMGYSMNSPSPVVETPVPTTGFGYKDQKLLFLHGTPDKKNMNKWVRHLEHPQKWRLLNDYYNALGDDTIRSLGTNPEEIKTLLDAYRPFLIRRMLTVSLNWAAKKPTERNTIPYEHYWIKFIRLFQRQGFFGGLWRSLQKVTPLDLSSSNEPS
ncbi:MAG: sulfotransferase [Leptolyngbyaceae bacterium]|nr:sulfotransferase [Leptolyngbyaceae bacterium]